MYASPNLAPNTREVYKRVWAKHVLPRLGDLTLRAITPGVVNLQLVEPMRRAGAGEPVILKTLTMLQSVMSLAVLHHGDVVPTNPVRAVRKPAQVRREAQPIWPTVVEEIRARLPQRDATMVSLLAYGGLRPEEMLALIWSDVRPTMLIVERALARGELRGDDLRKRHNRVVRPLAALAKDLAEWRLACGRPAPGELVFPRADGGPWRDHDWRTGGGASTSRSPGRPGCNRRARTTCAGRSCRCSSRRGARSSTSPTRPATPPRPACAITPGSFAMRRPNGCRRTSRSSRPGTHSDETLDAERTQQPSREERWADAFSAKFLLIGRSPLTDSNRRPLPYHGSALPTELRGQVR